MILGEKIRYLRTLKGYSQDDMAHLLDISPTAYGDIERGKTDVSHSRLEQIAKTMELSVLDLLSFGERIANYFANSSHNFINGNGNLYADREMTHELEKTKLENEKLRLEVRYWQEKWENSQRAAN